MMIDRVGLERRLRRLNWYWLKIATNEEQGRVVVSPSEEERGRDSPPCHYKLKYLL